MSNIRALNVINTQTIETRLFRMRELKDSIKTLEAEYKMLQEEVIATHFITNPEYKTSKGLVLATYKTQLRTQFQTTEFKKAEPTMYERFLEIKEVNVFLLK